MSIFGKGGQSTRDTLIARLSGQIGGRIVGGKFSFSSTEAVSRASIEQIYGTPEEFMKTYREFEKMYQSALDTDLSIGRAQSAYVDALRSSETINLRVLNKATADRLYNHYINHVLKLPQLLNSQGIPQIEMPSANFFTSAHKYRVEQGTQELHPGQVLLNRTMFSFNKDKAGMDSLAVGRSNILSSQSMERAARQSTPEAVMNILNRMQGGQSKIMTIDVETTGVFETSQVRSISGLEMTYRGGVFSLEDTPAVDLAFKSNQLSGLRVFGRNNTVKSLNELLAMVERKPGDTVGLMDMGAGGKTFLDETAKFIDRILEADILAGHNIAFDLGKIRETAMAQSGYRSHKGAQTAIKKLDEKIASGDYVIDTLELARSYLMKQAEEAISGQTLTEEAISSKYVNSLFAQETLARVHIGGSASYASVENIALNTNLFELLENEGKADQLYELIRKGSHIAETDTRLQSYIMQFVLTKELKIIDGMNQQNFSEMASWARSRILQSQAITPTTNIADVSWLSDTVFSKMLEEPTMRSNVTLMVTADELGFQGDKTKGVLKYIPGKGNVLGGFQFVTKEGVQKTVDDTTAFSIIRSTLQQARQQSVANTSGGLTNQQRAAAKILDLGLNIEQASSIGEVEELLSSKIVQTVVTGQESAAYISDMGDAIASVYKTLGSQLSAQDAINAARGRDIVGSVFQVGMSNYTGEAAVKIAQNFAKIGDPFAYIPMRDRVISTVMAESTAPIAKNIAFKSLDETITPTKLAITQTPELLAGMGVSFFEKTQIARVFQSIEGSLAPVQKVILPTNILDQVAKNVMGQDFAMREIGRSVVDEMVDRPRMLNAVWLAGREINKDQARLLATEIIQTMSDVNEVARLMKVDVAELDKTVKKTVGLATNISRGSSQVITEATEALAESIMERGIVMATAGEASEKAIQNMTAVGEVVDNEILMNQRTAARVAGLEDLNAVAVSPFIDRTTQQFVSDEIVSREAYETVDMVIGTDANGQPIQAKVSRFFVDLNTAAEKVTSDAEVAKNLRKKINRAKIGRSASSVITDLYIASKPKIALSMAGLAAAGTGYYIAKKHRERQLYNESIEAQPIERVSEVDQYNSYSSNFYDNRSYRRDPLATAGVVGNLDRAKIGHTRMGSDRYNHLFGGGY